MKRREKSEILERSLGLFNEPSPERMEEARANVLRRLKSRNDGLDADATLSSDTERTWRSPLWAVAAAIAIVVLLPAAMLWYGRAPGSLQSADGVHKLSYGELARSNHSEGAVVTLRDGSRVEMRSKSELALEKTEDGVRIRLDRGSVIVSAAKQHNGHLYVRTKDVTVSVVGTVFFVNTEEEGSRVAVIQGEVHVQQDGTSKKLLPGEQVASNPSMAPHPVAEEISWSRSAPAHIALLLQQSVVPAEPMPAFEVVSVRPSASGPAPSGRGGPGGVPGGNPPGPCGGLFDTTSIRVEPRRFIASTTTLFRLVALAYGKNCRMALESDLIALLPSWIKLDHFDIQAIIPEGTPVYTAQQLNDGQAPRLQMMIQAMLADRFRFALHRDMKEMAVYNLVVRSGTIKLSEDQTSADPEAELARMRASLSGYPLNGNVSRGPLSPPRGIFSYQVNPNAGKVTVSAAAIPMLVFMNAFQGSVGRPVIDKTEIKGLFDIPQQTLDVGPFDMVSGPSVWPAIVEQLGFKLESARAPVEILMIDHLEKPSEN
jgi:uncharacterized protein (TIGR03435 family)